MPLNLLKIYPDLLELAHMNEVQRTSSLAGIFKRDIEDNNALHFRNKVVRPIKGEDYGLHALFQHLTCEEIKIDDGNGKTYPKRIFEMSRSVRLHWVRHLIDSDDPKFKVFSAIDRDQKKRIDVTRTYIYDVEQQYIIVLEPQRSGQDYYLLTAYHLNRVEGKKSIEKKMKRKIGDIL